MVSTVASASMTKFDSIDLTAMKRDLFDFHNSAIKKQYHLFKDMPLYKNHVVNTQKMIVDGLPEGLCDRIIVLGPQMTEPWEILAARCKELVLIDCDEKSMDELCKQLSPSVLKKVKRVTCDLSAGAISYEDTMTSAEEFVEARIKFYGDFKPKIVLPKDLIGTADYVISSQICTCLLPYLEGLSDKIFFAKFKERIMACVNQDATRCFRYIMAVQTFRKTLESRHFVDLAMLAKPSGMIFFSDNIRESPFRPMVGPIEKRKLILEETLEDLPKKFHILATKDWVWLNHIENEMGEDVRGYLMGKKPAKVDS